MIVFRNYGLKEELLKFKKNKNIIWSVQEDQSLSYDYNIFSSLI